MKFLDGSKNTRVLRRGQDEASGKDSPNTAYAQTYGASHHMLKAERVTTKV